MTDAEAEAEWTRGLNKAGLREVNRAYEAQPNRSFFKFGGVKDIPNRFVQKWRQEQLAQQEREQAARELRRDEREERVTTPVVHTAAWTKWATLAAAGATALAIIATAATAIQAYVALKTLSLDKRKYRLELMKRQDQLAPPSQTTTQAPETPIR
jgi:hypothetical protein